MEQKIKHTEISILGLGLIGGSIAKALKYSSNLFFIKAFDLPEVTRQALEDKVIDKQLESVEESLSSDIIFLCLPVDNSLVAFKILAPSLKETTILTDVCGVKGVFEELWQSFASRGLYIGGHPMTGKEKGGYQNSDPLLFENAVYIVSDKEAGISKREQLLAVIKLLGARVVFLNPFEHDKVVANVSHLPQLLSVALVNNAAKNSRNKNNLDFAAGGFKDMTRIASSDFNIWKPVLKYNKNEIIEALDSLQNELNLMRNQLSANESDKLENEFIEARENRNIIPKDTKGFISPLFHISIYVKDEPGIISRISNALFSKNINIKDIELLKIREGLGGMFRLSFENETDAQKAKQILSDIGFETL
ncbi:MAG: prephenate dehydrogenase/arogenate dehydrogenase family protein [Ignavibacteria bacterium]